MADLKLSVIVGLVDRLSGPLKGLKNQLGAIRTQTAAMAASFSMAGMGAGAAGRSILGPLQEAVRSASSLSSALTEVGIVGEVGSVQIGALRPVLRDLAGQSNQFAGDLASALGILVGKGIDFDAAVAGMSALSRATTAANANLAEMAETQGAMLINAKLLPQELGRAFEMLIKSDVEGAFKLRNMARELPSLTAAAAGVKLTGLEQISTLGATLQIAMRGAGSESEAANNVLNLLQKLTSKETVANAEKYWGVDLPAAFAQWREQGLNPVVEALRLIQRETGGDAFKISEVFGDMQVMGALRPLLADMQGLLDLKAKMEGSTGLIDAMFERRTGEDPTLRWKGLSIAFSNLADQVGTVLLPPLERLAAVLRPIVESVGAWAKAHPQLASTLLAVAAGIGGLLLVLGPLLMGIGGVLGGLGLFASALGLLASPVALAVAGIGALVAMFAYFRDDIVRWVVDAVFTVQAKFNELVAWLSDLAGRIKILATAVGQAMVDGILGPLQRGWAAVKEAAHKLTGGMIGEARGPEGADAHSPSRKMIRLGRDMVRGLEIGLAMRRGLMGAAAGLALAAPSAAALAAPAAASGGINMPITINITAPAGVDAQAFAALVRREVAGATQAAAGRIARLYDTSDGF